jgi:hypothetical protein
MVRAGGRDGGGTTSSSQSGARAVLVPPMVEIMWEGVVLDCFVEGICRGQRTVPFVLSQNTNKERHKSPSFRRKEPRGVTVRSCLQPRRRTDRFTEAQDTVPFLHGDKGLNYIQEIYVMLCKCFVHYQLWHRCDRCLAWKRRDPFTKKQSCDMGDGRCSTGSNTTGWGADPL